jgi:23S rRNA (guanine745-N1)-methyltransferase
VPGGALVVVTPTRRHLAELVPAVGMLTVGERKRERLESRLGGAFAAEGETAVERGLSLDHRDLADVVAMGPSARHLEAGQVAERVAELPEPYDVTVSVRLATYRRA